MSTASGSSTYSEHCCEVLWGEESHKPSLFTMNPGSCRHTLSNQVTFPHSSKEHHRLFELRESFDEIPPQKFTEARNKCNEYERIGRGPFVNRSAMKLANLDFVFKLVKGATANDNAANSCVNQEFAFADIW
jgi:hypothetical protein